MCFLWVNLRYNLASMINTGLEMFFRRALGVCRLLPKVLGVACTLQIYTRGVWAGRTGGGVMGVRRIGGTCYSSVTLWWGALVGIGGTHLR